MKSFVEGLSKRSYTSHLTQVRGLKLSILDNHLIIQKVAPHAGAWIEIISGSLNNSFNMSHLTQVRGLKY
ncbi:hypothetical protein MOUSESFB_0655 [Candidatus Arthromitus sp. SFB-mouse-Yit]|nr:hypothetical protein MOUSESFB_0655 [Candidatus Arthromitus sp. SFB-mouse-Yit]